MEYNPYKPFILGQEWVPILEQNGGDISYFPEGRIEVGNSFFLGQSRIAQDVRLYSRGPYPGYTMVNIYPENAIGSAGPVRRVLIPVNNTSMTGVGSGFQGGANGAECLLTVTDSKYVNLPIAVNTTPTQAYFRAYFATNAYSALLQNKRILQVNFLMAQLTKFQDQVNFFTPATNSFFSMGVHTSLNDNFFTGPNFASASANWTNPGVVRNVGYGYTDDTNLVDVVKVFRMNGGSVGTRSTTPNSFPWTYADLQRWEISASDRLALQVDWSTDRGDGLGISSNVTNQLHYLAMEVIYCEETRVATGVGFNFQTAPEMLIVPVYNLSKVANPPLTSGSYVVTAASAQTAENDILTQQYQPWNLKGLRELYALPTFNSYEITVPTPYDETIEDKTFSTVKRTVVPQLTVNTTGSAVLTEVHPYGDQAQAQVYGSITATQGIMDSGLGQTRSYPWVRWYARRYGDTRVPLALTSPTLTASSVQITRTDFDALPEIINGWKEITLRFPTPPTMGGGTNPTWTWSAAGEAIDSRWEVLGAVAPAISATPGNLLNQAPSFSLLGPATYGQPVSGSQINLAWVPGVTPLQNTTSADPSADAALLFSTDPQTPTSFAVSPLSMALAPPTQNCPVPSAAACIPTALSFNALSWQPVSGAAFDDFTRVVASGWGTSTLGQPWTNTTGTAADFSVNGAQGVHRHAAGAATNMISTMNAQSPDVEIFAQVSTDALEPAGGSNVIHYLYARFTDTSNTLRLAFTANSVTRDLSIQRVVGGTSTTLSQFFLTNDITYDSTNVYYMKFRLSGPNMWGKLWEDSTPEPDAWQVFATDTTYLTQTWVGYRSFNSSTSAPQINFFVDNFKTTPADVGATEIQRYDPVDGQFNTIMLCTNPAVTGFSDFEARVGQPSVYRIRNRNVYDFAGLWSPQITGTVPSPGVTGASVALLMFTSNARQNGSLNLAYSAEWEGTPVETFQWSEAGQVALQMMYGKNFPTSFHPLERGGEAFSRAILVSAAGIPLVTKENGFEDLRDMAWATVPYICVRDELGNRWYSLVTVPEGSRRRMVNKGHLLVSTVNVVETTDTPFAVDP